MTYSFQYENSFLKFNVIKTSFVKRSRISVPTYLTYFNTTFKPRRQIEKKGPFFCSFAYLPFFYNYRLSLNIQNLHKKHLKKKRFI